MIQPLVFLALFAPLLSERHRARDAVSSLQWFVPGIVVMSCLFGTSMTGSNLLLEMQTGSHERMLVTPLSRSALLIGRALKEIVPMLRAGGHHRRGRRPVRLRAAPRSASSSGC